MGDPNDEAIAGHRRYDRGLNDVPWAAVVHNSALVSSLERINSVYPRHDPQRFDRLTHHVLSLKETTVEVVARTVRIVRIPGPTTRAAATALETEADQSGGPPG